jgi:class 3 adenylate cyclase
MVVSSRNTKATAFSPIAGIRKRMSMTPSARFDAALNLVEAVPKLVTSASSPLQVHVGIATGLVVVGDLIGAGAAHEHAVVGETPNLAARLQAPTQARS